MEVDTIAFESKMVNDFNQHLCGGWRMPEIPDEKEATINQLIQQRKPFACLPYRKEGDALEAQQRLMDAGLITDLRQRHHPTWDDRDAIIYDLAACQAISIGQIGDLETLFFDYGDAGIDIDVASCADRPLASFFGEWDVEDNPLWLTGLLLGYPIENTISLYLREP